MALSIVDFLLLNCTALLTEFRVVVNCLWGFLYVSSWTELFDTDFIVRAALDEVVFNKTCSFASRESDGKSVLMSCQ